MTRHIHILLLLLFLSAGPGSVFAHTRESPPVRKQPLSTEGRWERIKGRPARNALLLGMWSYHMVSSGDLYSEGRYKEHNDLLGIQWAGFGFGTFINSHGDRTVFAGVARETYSNQPSANTRIDAGYYLGLMHGYGENLPNIYGISPQPWLKLGMSWRKVGLDFGFAPFTILTFGFRIDLE